MPFKSQAQEKYLYSQRPDIAARWQRENPNQNFSNLPAKSTSAWASAKKFAGGGAVPDPEYMTMDDGRAPMSMGQPDVVQPPAATEQPVGTSTPEQAPQQPGGMDVDLIRNQLQAYLSQQKKSQDAMQQLADLHQKQMEEKAGRPNLNALAQLADTYYGTKIADAIPKNPTSDQVSEEALKNKAEVMKTGQPIAQDLIKEYAAANTPLMKKYAMDLKNQMDSKKADSDLGNKLSTVTSRGVNKSYAEAIRRGNNVQSLLDRYPNLDDMPNEQVHLLTQEIDGLINGGAPTVVGVQGALPKSIASRWQKLMSETSNEPQGAQLGGFISQMQPYIGDVIKNSRQYLHGAKQELVDSYKSRLTPDAYQRHLENVDKDLGAGPAPSSVDLPNKIPARGAAPTVDVAPVPGAIHQTSPSTGRTFWKYPDGSLHEIKNAR